MTNCHAEKEKNLFYSVYISISIANIYNVDKFIIITLIVTIKCTDKK